MTRPSRPAWRGIRRRLVAHLSGHEDGITMAIFGIALLVLLGMVALGVDGSRIYDERRSAQNAADHAAIAAAFAACETDDVDVRLAAAQAAGLASAEENGYDDNGTTNDVTITIVGSLAEYSYEAEVDTTIPTTFGTVLGFDTLDTTARAEARATGCDSTGGGVPAIYGGGDCVGYEKDIDVSGENHTVNGLLHTNGDFYQSASNSEFLNAAGPSVTYVGEFEGKESNGNIYVQAEQQTTVQPWPTGYDPAQMNTAWWNLWKFSPNRRNTSSDTQSNINVTADGIYYTETTSTVQVKNFTNGVKFTIVSKNAPVQFPDTHTGTYWAYPNNPAGTPANLMVVSGYSPPVHERCAKMAFMRSGNQGTWNGLFWGPNANVEWSGNDGTVNGGLIGYSIKLNGNNHTFNGGTGLGEAVPDVLLLR